MSQMRDFPLKKLNFPVCLAPMVGLSHVAFRLMLRHYMPENAWTIWPTEMLNSRRLPNEDFATTPETLRAANENDLVPQILGNEENAIAKSVQKLEEWGAVGIDINMGCPVQKALKHNYGVALMGDAAYAQEVVRMTVRHTGLPVSVKLRAGLDDRIETLIDFVRRIQDAGAQWITLHPRLAHEKRRGVADWSRIREVREALQIPVIGNGDVQTVEDIEVLFSSSQCDLVMIGRALTARPWLLWQYSHRKGWANPPGLNQVEQNRKPPESPEEEGAEYGRSLGLLLHYMREHFDESYGVRKFKFFVKTSSPWLEFGHTLCSKVSSSGTYQDIERQLNDFFSRPHRMSQRTQLRI